MVDHCRDQEKCYRDRDRDANSRREMDLLQVKSLIFHCT